MLSFQPETFLISGIIFVWLAALSFLIFRVLSHYQKITDGGKNKNLEAVLDKILKAQELESKELNDLIKKTGKLEQDGLSHIQNMSLVRFNPFAETGGDQSFALAVLDDHNSGFILSSLHGRDNTRLYAKEVKEGKAVKYQFSKEEEQAVEKAKKLNNGK